MDRYALYAFMSQYRYGVISSMSEEGTPQSALVGIAISPELEIIFDTVKSSRKYANLIARPSCSLVVGWGGEQTVQFEGIAAEPNGIMLKKCQDIYFSVWPEGRTRLEWSGITYFIVPPQWIRYSDFDQSPPAIAEMTTGDFTPRVQDIARNHPHQH